LSCSFQQRKITPTTVHVTLQTNVASCLHLRRRSSRVLSIFALSRDLLFFGRSFFAICLIFQSILAILRKLFLSQHFLPSCCISSSLFATLFHKPYTNAHTTEARSSSVGAVTRHLKDRLFRTPHFLQHYSSLTLDLRTSQTSVCTLVVVLGS